MVDFHSHILPSLDDGAKDIETSLEMLKLSKELGINTIVSTSHCHTFNGNNDILKFLDARNESYNTLVKEISKNPSLYPKIVLGAEVYLSNNLSKCDDLKKLTIGDTDYILLEMPSTDWNDELFEEIYKISCLGLKPIIAHLDRYLDLEDRFSELFSLDVLFQINSDAFFKRPIRRKISEFFYQDAIHVIGSDMHNLDSRSQTLKKAYAVIDKKFGKDYSRYLRHSAVHILNNETVSHARLKKLSFKQKLFL